MLSGHILTEQSEKRRDNDGDRVDSDHHPRPRIPGHLGGPPGDSGDRGPLARAVEAQVVVGGGAHAEVAPPPRQVVAPPARDARGIVGLAALVRVHAALGIGGVALEAARAAEVFCNE